MSATPTVSVCVPTYNGEAYLAECLDSVLAQTLADFELLIVDDCSSDGTLALAEAYARRDPRVRVARNARNLGLVGNWNRCVELAAGEWVKFVFQDDTIAPTCLERMVAAGRRGYPIVACARDFLFAPGTPERDREFYAWHRALVGRVLREETTAEQFGEATLDHLDTNLLGEPTAVLLHRSAFARFGRFNEHMVQTVDGEFWARVGTSTGVAYVPDALAAFRVHPASTTARNTTTRQARVTLDALVVRHEAAFGPAYATLRAVCRARRPDVDLERWFWEGAYLTLVVDGVAATLRRAGGRVRAEAESVYAAYPRLRRAARGSRVRRAVSGYLGRHPRAARAYRLAKETGRRAAALLGRGGAAPSAPAAAGYR